MTAGNLNAYYPLLLKTQDLRTGKRDCVSSPKFLRLFLFVCCLLISMTLISCRSTPDFDEMKMHDLVGYFNSITDKKSVLLQLKPEQRRRIEVRLSGTSVEMPFEVSLVILASMDTNCVSLSHRSFADYWIIEPFENTGGNWNKLASLGRAVMNDVDSKAGNSLAQSKHYSRFLLPPPLAQNLLNYVQGIWPVSKIAILPSSEENGARDLAMIMETLHTAVLIHEVPCDEQETMLDANWRKNVSQDISIFHNAGLFSSNNIPKFFTNARLSE